MSAMNEPQWSTKQIMETGRKLHELCRRTQLDGSECLMVYTLYRMAFQEVTGCHFDDFAFAASNDEALAAISMALYRDLPERDCPDCGVPAGSAHEDGCDIERCTVCRGQRMCCACEGHDKRAARWTGEFPEEMRR